MLKQFTKRLLSAAGYAVFDTRKHYAADGLGTLHHPRFREDEEFLAAYARGLQAAHGVDPNFEWRIHVALWSASAAAKAPGDFVECGVNAGFVSSAIMQYLGWGSLARKFYLVDTFAGPVFSQYSEAEIADQRAAVAQRSVAAGAYVTDLKRVTDNFAEWPNAVVIQGVVPDVLSSLAIRQVAFLHLDLNCAYPERAALEFFWDLLSPGAVVLLDDYNYFGHQHQSESIDAVAQRFGARTLALPTGQGLIIK